MCTNSKYIQIICSRTENPTLLPKKLIVLLESKGYNPDDNTAAMPKQKTDEKKIIPFKSSIPNFLKKVNAMQRHCPFKGYSENNFFMVGFFCFNGQLPSQKAKSDIIEIDYNEYIKPTWYYIAHYNRGYLGLVTGKIVERQKDYIKNEGMQEGRDEGRKEGMQEGKKEGMQEGRKEGMKEGKIVMCLKFALELKEKNPVNFVMQRIDENVTENEIETIGKKLKLL